MRKPIAGVVLGLVVVFAAFAAYAQSTEEGPSPDNIERQKLAQTGMKFLSISVDPRAAAMGNAMTAVEGSSVAMFYNPASMAGLDGNFQAMLGYNQWIADITYNSGAAAYAPGDGRYGVFGVSVMAVDYGELQETVRSNNKSGYRKTGSYSPSAAAIGVGYARALTNRFSIGGHLRLARQVLGSAPVSMDESEQVVRREYAQNAIVSDFGILYRTGFRSLIFAMSVRNFSKEYTYAEESFELPLTFQAGVSMDVTDFTDFNANTHSFLISLDTIRPRDYQQYVRAGGEYHFMEMFALRGGYSFPQDEEGLSLGAGIKVSPGNIDIGADYSYTEFGVFGSINRIALSFNL